MYTTNHILQLLNCTKQELHSLHTTGGVPLPGQFGRTVRAYSDADLLVLRSVLQRSRMPTTADVCRRLNVTRDAIEGMQGRGLNAPSERYGKRPVWTPTDMNELKAWIERAKV